MFSSTAGQVTPPPLGALRMAYLYDEKRTMERGRASAGDTE
jgi:hypothetical protein